MAGLAFAAVAIVVILRQAPPAQPGPETAAAVPVSEEVSREEMRDALVDRIAGESAGLAVAPAHSPPPGSSSFARDNTPFAPPTPPPGYSFIPAPQQMAISRPPWQGDIEPPPPTSHPAWLDDTASVAMLTDQAAGAVRDNTFAWVGLADGAESDALGAALNALGGEILGSAGPLVRVRLPADPGRVEQIASLPEVAGLGAPPRSVKLPEALAREVRSLPADQQYPVFINLMTGDPDGQWRRELAAFGAVVGRFDADIRAYTATVDWPALDAIANADFVLAVEPIGLVEAAHDTAVPAMGVDALRWHSGSPGLFRGIGGASVPIAVMDTGLNINHPDIATNRRSICGANFVWVDARRSEYDLWVDDGGHGTHVTGTLAGNGYIRPEYAGMAPAVSHIRFAKVLSHRGWGYSDGILQGMDWLSLPTACGESGSRANRVKPLIVNMSLGSAANIFEGRGNGERKLDSVVWAHRQLYVVAQSNSGSYAFSNYGSAKNSLSVGAAMDSGELAWFSSLGPTADGRLAPQIVATGVDVNSARGAGGRGGYVSYNGTSMASPTVAGVAALLMDASPAYREQPALTRARLMASAIRPNIWLESAERFPATNSNGPGDLHNRFGLGKVSARTSVLNRDEADGWLSGGAISRVEDGEVAEHDIAMPAGASQLALVMTWDEPPTDTIAEAVLNDLDLYLDLDGNCGPGACGEYRSLSRKDNVEWIILDDPPAGVHRAKIAAKRVFTEAPRAALA
ncbi:MAG: S8 family serine peptidase, partial [Gammaproteobacteria bacterium]|nr:S8 family serine peptidase [Gammaproteobacteria bacterium]